MTDTQCATLAMMPASVSRRWFVGGGAALGAAVISGCHPGGGASTATGAIAVANSPFYVDASTNPGFTAATGTRVEYHEEVLDEELWFASAADRLGRQRPLDRDVVVVSDWLAARLNRRSWLQPLPLEHIPNRSHITAPVDDPVHT